LLFEIVTVSTLSKIALLLNVSTSGVYNNVQNTMYKDVFQKSHVNVITISFIVHNALQIWRLTDDDNSGLLIGSYE